MKLAIKAHIDAFALNIAKDEDTNESSLGNVFLAAQNVGFYLFFSFDYAAEPGGPDSASDWVDIKAQTNCFFVPDWSSLGAKDALALADGVADGLFSWTTWPNGPNDIDIYVDASYIQYLDGNLYMIPILPWFFTNMPGFDKNWLWRGLIHSLCSCSYGYGFCPIHHCNCTSTGPLVVPPAKNVSMTGFFTEGDDSDLCNFTCQRGYCPSPICRDYSDDNLVCGASDSDFDNDVDCGDTFPCDFTKDYASLEDLEQDSNTLKPYCVDYYSINVLFNMLDESLVGYNSIANGSYDKKFDDYVEYIKKTVPVQLKEFMSPSNGSYGRGNKYFQCIVADPNNGTAIDCSTAFVGYPGFKVSVYYELLDSDGFFADITTTYGIQQNWVKFGKDEGLSCNALPEPGDMCYVYYGIPLGADDYRVENPNDITIKALPNIQKFKSTIFLTQLEIVAGTWGGVRDPESFAITAASRRKMTVEDITSLGTVFKKHDDDFQSVIGRCKKEL